MHAISSLHRNISLYNAMWNNKYIENFNKTLGAKPYATVFNPKLNKL